MSGLRLRKYRPEDWDEVVKLFHDTVHNVNSADYADTLLDAWAPDDMALPELKDRLANSYAVVAVKDDIIVGFGNACGAGYFDCLYTHKDYQRAGVATLIADDVEGFLHRSGTRTITVDASITAKPFFINRGYAMLKKQSVECRGRQFINFRMEKPLAPAPCYPRPATAS